MLQKYNLQYSKKDGTLKVAQEVTSKSTQYIISGHFRLSPVGVGWQKLNTINVTQKK